MKPSRGSSRSGANSGREGTEIRSLSAILHILQHCPERITSLWLPAKDSSTRMRALRDATHAQGVSFDRTPESHSEEESARAVVRPYEYAELEQVIELKNARPRSVVLALDHIQDPQNLGALCRTADALDVLAVLVPKDRGATVTEGAYHASAGAVETIPICRVTNLGDALRKLKDAGFWVIGTQIGPNAKPPESTPSFEHAVLVMGAEWEGLSPTIEKICDWLVQIPISGRVQSLNVSVAGALLMYYFTRRGE